MTIREFIELHMEIYRLQNDTKIFNAIKTKVSRELKNIDSWYELEKKQAVGKTTAYILDETTKNELSTAMRPYFQKLAKIQSNEFEKEKKANLTRVQNMDSPFVIDNRSADEAYIYEVPKADKLYVMIEALFNEMFEIDEDGWTADYTNRHLFMNDEEALLSDSVALSNLRLQNPQKYYVKKKNKS